MKRRLISFVLIVASLFCLCSCTKQNANSSFCIQFIDVGQGDAALVECDGHYMLIDGGNIDAGDTVRNYLEKEGIRQLDILAISHLHEDHYGGLAEALTRVSKIGITLSNSNYRDLLSFKDLKHELNLCGSNITVPRTGDKYKLGSAEIEVADVSANEDNDSLVILITYGKTRFLFTGDIGYSGQKRLIEKYQNKDDDPFKIDLIKMPHHGSYSSTTVGTTNSLILFLRTFMPDYSVISVGAGNKYGHPHRETLDLLDQAKSKVYRTDYDGTIIVKSDGKELSIETSK